MRSVAGLLGEISGRVASCLVRSVVGLLGEIKGRVA